MRKTRLEQLNNLIGNTPLIKINYKYENKKNEIYFKAEWYSLTGSIKDRVALNIITKAYENKKLKRGQEIVETSSGNTGISFSAVGTYLGHPVSIVMPDYMSEERHGLIKSYGAKLVLCSKEEGGFLGCFKKAEELAKVKKAFMPLQFENKYNTDTHYKFTGKEIIDQLKKINKTPSVFVSGAGTAGTLMGVGKLFKEINNDSKIYVLEPKSSPTLRSGKKVGYHSIQGINDEFVPALYKNDLVEDIIDVDDKDSICMAQKLAIELGLGVGISSGANFLGAVLAQQCLSKKDLVVSIFVDDSKKYLSTFMDKKIINNPNYLSNKIKLLSYEVIV